MKNDIKNGNEGICKVVVGGRLDKRWEEWFDAMQIRIENDHTIITGTVSDEAALLGLIERVCTLSLSVRSIKYTARDS